VNSVEYQRHVTTTQNSLRVLADQTGGLALVDRNDLAKGLSQIDAETSDYYVLGYYSSNPDPSRKLRRVRVEVKRPGAAVRSRPSYSLKPK
jgi:VWFA-related protein